MILCVEDDASIRDIEVYTLNSTGFEALQTETRSGPRSVSRSRSLCFWT